MRHRASARIAAALATLLGSLAAAAAPGPIGAAADETRGTPAPPAPRVEYLSIEANEGGSSGGHVALRLGDAVYHFQHESGALVMRRESWRRFEFRYRVVENRGLRALSLPFSADEAQRLRGHLDERVVLEASERAAEQALQDDVTLLEALAGSAAGFGVRGAGFFARDRSPASEIEAAGARALARLRERVEHERGAVAVKRRAEARAHLGDLAAPAPDAPAPLGLAALGSYSLSERYADALAAELAWRVLDEAPPLARAALRRLPESVAALEPELRRSLEALGSALEADLLRRFEARRPGWGFAALLGMARLAALAESLAGGELRLLDAFPAGAPTLATATLDAAREPLEQHLAWHGAELAAARRALTARPRDERSLSRLEAAASRYAELAAALAGEATLRLPAGPLAPSARARVAPLPRPAFADADPTRRLREARDRLRAWRAARRQRDAYDLVTRNCVTELRRTLRVALSPAGELDASEPYPGEAPFAFVPLLSERAVAARWGAGSVRSLPSQRRVRLAEATRGAAGWLVALRESNTWTARLYAPHPEDSIFLFFTDGPLLARPLLGAANLATGLTASAAGLLSWPLDGGTLLRRGLRGSAASLPELIFLSIRKGSYPFALPTRPKSPSRADAIARLRSAPRRAD